MGKRFTVLLSFALLASTLSAQEHIHRRDLRHKLFSKGALIKTGFSAVYQTVRNSPHEWGRSAGSFVKRAGSSYGQRAIKGVVEYGIASKWTHEDLRYRRSEAEGVFPRIKYVVLSSFWVPRDAGSGKTFAAGRVSGAFAAGQVARSWMPQRVATFGAGMASMGWGLGMDVGFNAVREFWPRRR